jgi:hypothetical protein
VPEEAHEAVYDDIEQQLLALADDPIRHFLHGPAGRPTSVITFTAEGRRYYWGVILHFAEDEHTLVLTEFVRLKLIL